MQISKEETKRLEQLYKLANKYNDDETWNKVDLFFEQMGKKYQFDPETNIITSKGEIQKISLCNKCGNIANTSNGVRYERVRETYKMVNLPICIGCLMKYYPERCGDD